MNPQINVRKFLEMLWLNSIFIANFVQGIWWASNTIWLKQPINYLVLILQLSCVFLRCSQQILISKEYGLNFVIHIVSLLYYVIYFESFLHMEMNHNLQSLSNCLLIIFTYIEYLKIAMCKQSLICRLGIAFYLIIRVLCTVIIDFKIYQLESLIILGLLFIKYTTELYNSFKNNFQEKLPKYQLAIKEEREATPLPQNEQIFPQIQSQSKVSLNLTPQHNMSIFLRDLPSEIKLIQYSNLTNCQKLNKSFEKSDQSMCSFYQNLLNIFPQGILILNSSQQVSYMNNKCEKLLECQGAEKVLEKIKTCVNNAKMQHYQIDDLSSFQAKQHQKQIHYHILKQIISILSNRNIAVDVLDIMIQPQKYSNTIIQVLCRRCLFMNGLSNQDLIFLILKKSLKLIIIPTSMTVQQQEYFQSQSQIQSSSKVVFQPTTDFDNPVLLIIIKNITHKHKFQQIRDEQIIHHSLIKSFSHELRTPLNSCQNMLNLIQQFQSEEDFKTCLGIAQNSIQLLIHQINDILDYAAIQSYQFSYHITQFPFNLIINEIEELYKCQMKLKKIKFKILISKSLKDIMMRNDKQRILQILINLLNNSIKFTKEGGCIHLNITEKEYFCINIEVKDNGIGIAEDQLNLIRSSLYDTSEFGAILKQNAEIKKKGLGLSIVAKLVQGLTQAQDNKLVINSLKHQGTSVSFQVENLQIIQNSYQQSSNLFTQQTGRFNQSEIFYTFNKIKNNDKMQNKINNTFSQIQDDQDNLEQNSETYKATSGLNDFEIQKEILLPVSHEYFPHKFISSCKDFQELDQEQPNVQKQKLICQKCSHVLVVDDIPFNQIALKMMLKHYNLEADSVFDGFQAIEKVKQKLQQHCQTYQVIFMDIEMPGMDGFQASKQILKLTQNQSTIVICSAYDTQENYIKGSKLGINTFLPKPVNPIELKVVLETLLQFKGYNY
ncbi:unnamed protein product (macronuclear) [Paramecium tetraurelia]|uniref:Uncharacterized protein n=1 Tax=Paramecium tetraurelia TaxID=5888 RepID=A0CGD4_PARTE|nr:uncharacterized protein GSPATT00007291001 [Paramecium tetraurelia]CAK69851.1 unnamed protein product [Paramecium tetraurelia]|eukprot:XP_001437248.1 hypothetical protein (macronuclear) [Paramecium tetraurelia strain d4-2]